MDKDEIVRKLTQIRNMYTAMGVPFNEDYEWGFYNGIEVALSFVENRPAFYLDKEGRYNQYDIKKYPEYFL